MKITSKKVYGVEGLPNETFETEGDAAVASIMLMLNIPLNQWDIVEENLRTHASDISQRLRVLLEPKNRS